MYRSVSQPEPQSTPLSLDLRDLGRQLRTAEFPEGLQAQSQGRAQCGRRKLEIVFFYVIRTQQKLVTRRKLTCTQQNKSKNYPRKGPRTVPQRPSSMSHSIFCPKTVALLLHRHVLTLCDCELCFSTASLSSA